MYAAALRLAAPLALALTLAGCLWKPDPGVAPLALAEAPVSALTLTEAREDLEIVVVVRAGSALDTPGREGLAWLAAESVAGAGAGALDPQQIAAQLESWGASLRVSVGPELVTFTLTCPPAHAEEAARLLGERVVAPRLTPGVLADAQRRAAELEATLTSPASPSLLAREALGLWLYEAHPYGHAATGRAGSRSAVTLLDVQQFLSRRYVRAVITGGVAGPASPERERAAAALGEQLSRAAPLLSSPTTPRLIPERKDRALLLVRAEGIGERVALRLGQGLDLRWDEPDAAALELAVAALRERLAALDDVARTGALTLGRGEAVQSAIQVSLELDDPARAPEALVRALRVVELWAQDGVEQSELLPPEAPAPSLPAALGARVLRWPDPSLPLPQAAEPPSPARVNAAIARWIRPDLWSVVAVLADPDALRAGLVEYPAASDVQASAATSGAPSDPGAAPETRYKGGIDRVTVVNATELFR